MDKPSLKLGQYCAKVDRDESIKQFLERASAHSPRESVGLLKTKNVPKVVKCKINHSFFLTNMGLPNWGEGGVVPDLGKIHRFSRFFWQTSLSDEVLAYANRGVALVLAWLTLD